MGLRSMDRRDPKFSKTLEAGFSNLKSLMEIYHWQSEQGRWFLHADLITADIANLGNIVWSPSDEDEAVRYPRDRLSSDF